MAAPKKPKTAGGRTGKSKATASIDTSKASAAGIAPRSNGNGAGAPNAELIRVRAYELFMSRGGTPGDELSDWLTAEREIMEKFASHD